MRFHNTITELAGNPVLLEHLRRVQDQAVLAAYAGSWRPSQHPAADEHAAILAALRARDRAAAGNAARDHIDRIRERVETEWLGSSSPEGPEK